MSKLRSALSDSLATDPHQAPLVVAYSGGLDSSCLLHVAAGLASAEQRPLRAIHVNHGISAAADQWQDHCRQVCAGLGIALDCAAVTLLSDASEDQAREARYEAFATRLRGAECLLLAHHLDDQLETLLLRLLRGAGPGGLAGMPARRSLGEGQLLRPWLGLPRSELEAYAASQKLSWVEDESNAATRFDRNFCRQEILPRLEQRWPEYRSSWQKSQELLRDSDALLGDLAVLDLARLAGDKPGIIKLEPLQALSPARQRNVLRHWLQHNLGLRAVNWALLQRLTTDIVPPGSATDATLEVGEFLLQVFQQQLFALRASQAWLPPAEQPWSAVTQPSLVLPGNGRLAARSTVGSGLARSHGEQLCIRYRQGGESLQLPGRPTKTLKKLFQELGVPPWLRDRVPLLFAGDELICVPGVGVASEFCARPEQPGLLLQWQHPELVLTRVLGSGTGSRDH